MNHRYLILAIVFYLLACVTFGLKLFREMQGDTRKFYIYVVYACLVLAFMSSIKYIFHILNSKKKNANKG